LLQTTSQAARWRPRRNPPTPANSSATVKSFGLELVRVFMGAGIGEIVVDQSWKINYRSVMSMRSDRIKYERLGASNLLRLQLPRIHQHRDRFSASGGIGNQLSLSCDCIFAPCSAASQ